MSDLMQVTDTDIIKKTACLVHAASHAPKKDGVVDNTFSVSYAHEITCKLLGHYAGDILTVEQPISYKYGSYTTDRLGDNFIIGYVAIAYHNAEALFGLNDGELRHEHFVEIKQKLKEIVQDAYGI